MKIYELQEVGPDGYDVFTVGFYLKKETAEKFLKAKSKEARRIATELKAKKPVFTYRVEPRTVYEG